MKKLILSLVAIVMSLTSGATTFEEFFEAVKNIKGCDYMNIPTAMMQNQPDLEKLELCFLSNLSDTDANTINELRNQISVTENMSVVKNEDDLKIYILTNEEKVNILIAGVENSQNDKKYIVALMVGNKSLIDNPDFMKIIRE